MAQSRIPEILASASGTNVVLSIDVDLGNVNKDSAIICMGVITALAPGAITINASDPDTGESFHAPTLIANQHTAAVIILGVDGACSVLARNAVPDTQLSQPTTHNKPLRQRLRLTMSAQGAGITGKIAIIGEKLKG